MLSYNGIKFCIVIFNFNLKGNLEVNSVTILPSVRKFPVNFIISGIGHSGIGRFMEIKRFPIS